MIRNSRAEVVGSPVYENKVRVLPPGEKILLVNQCFSNYGEATWKEEYEFVRQVIKAASDFSTVELRLHPHNDLSVYRRLRSQAVNVTLDRPLHKSLEDAGIVLAVNSTVILEAMLMGRPVLTLDWHPSPFEQPVRAGVTRCRDIHEMRDALKLWKNNGYRSPDLTETVQREILAFNAYTGEEAITRIVRALGSFIARN
jgi:hypothetical protein